MKAYVETVASEQSDLWSELIGDATRAVAASLSPNASPNDFNYLIRFRRYFVVEYL